MTHAQDYLNECAKIAAAIDDDQVEQITNELKNLRERRGRLFIVGLGGSAANASHAANDFRKLAGVEAYALSDNVAELTARANDDGWNTIYSGALRASGANKLDALLVLSVGGGVPGGVSMPLVCAIDYAISIRMRVLGIVGRDGGYAALRGDCVVIVPTVIPVRVTPHTEAFQSVILHCIVSHPDFQIADTKW